MVFLLPKAAAIAVSRGSVAFLRVSESCYSLTAFSDFVTYLGWPRLFPPFPMQLGSNGRRNKVVDTTQLQILVAQRAWPSRAQIFQSHLPTGLYQTSGHAFQACCLMHSWSFGIRTGAPIVRCTSPRLVTRLAMSDNAAKLAELYAGFKDQFPNVKPITAKELHSELQGPNGQSIILLDIRTPQEWEVSRLPGNVLTTDAFETVRGETAKSAPLVTYWYTASPTCMHVLASYAGAYSAPVCTQPLPPSLHLHRHLLRRPSDSQAECSFDVPTVLQHCRTEEWQVC